MEIQNIKKQYIGRANQDLSWGELTDIFNTIWEEKNQSLKKFPMIIGEVNASWVDAAGIEHKLQAFDELQKPFTGYKTAEIIFFGHLPKNKIRSTFCYIPAEKAASISIQTNDIGLTEKIIVKVKTYFPNKYEKTGDIGAQEKMPFPWEFKPNLYGIELDFKKIVSWFKYKFKKR